MKVIIASDVHGSAYYINKLIESFKAEDGALLVLLGDVFNHGPRNPLPKDYAPLKVADALNEIKDKLIVIKGNCDSEVDTLISDFDFIENTVILSGDKKVFLSHGHVYNKDFMPKQKFDAVLYGHFHLGFIESFNGAVIANPGSISLPKDDFQGYLVLEDGALYLKSFDGEVKKSIRL